MITRTYSEMRTLSTFKERFDYLKLRGQVGAFTFGMDRHLNQRFYRSTEWKNLRHEIIVRDEGSDLGVEGFEIYDKIIIHHMNPMIPKDLYDKNEEILNPEYLVSVSHQTHNAIHYGNESLLPRVTFDRKPGDTKLW